jgi:hypothetical protein
MAASSVTPKCVATPRFPESSPVEFLRGREESGHAMAPGNRSGERWAPAFSDSEIAFFI